MKIELITLVLTALFFSAMPPVFGQHHTLHTDHSELVEPEPHIPHWRMAVLLGHTFIPAGSQNNQRLLIPSWGLDLEYWPASKWGIGLHNDLEIETFLIEKPEEEALERRYPLVITADLLYKPWKGLVLMAGPGVEVDPSQTFFLIRYGLEYEFEFSGHWDIFPSVFYDSRKDAFDTWSIALGVGKRF